MDAGSLSFEQLQSVHDDLSGVFTLHQELMVCGEVALADEILDLFASLLEVHMNQEENHLFPLIIRLLKMAPDRAVPLIGEHERMMLLVRIFQVKMKDLLKLSASEQRRGSSTCWTNKVNSNICSCHMMNRNMSCCCPA